MGGVVDQAACSEKAFSNLTEEECDDLPGTNNPVKSINSQFEASRPTPHLSA